MCSRRETHTFLDNIMLRIRAVGNGGGNNPPKQIAEKDSFNRFKQNDYNFVELEQELLLNI